MELFKKTTLRSFFTKEFVEEKKKEVVGYIMASKQMAFWPVFMLYGISFVLLLKFAQILLG